jgi:hypothetical protein
VPCIQECSVVAKKGDYERRTDAATEYSTARTKVQHSCFNVFSHQVFAPDAQKTAWSKKGKVIWVRILWIYLFRHSVVMFVPVPSRVWYSSLEHSQRYGPIFYDGEETGGRTAMVRFVPVRLPQQHFCSLLETAPENGGFFGITHQRYHPS